MLQTAQHVHRTDCYYTCYDVIRCLHVQRQLRSASFWKPTYDLLPRSAKDVFRLQQAWATDADALVMISPSRWGEYRVLIQDETRWSKYLWNHVSLYIYIIYNIYIYNVYLFCFLSFYHSISYRFSQVFRTVITPHQGHQLCHWQPARCVIPCCQKPPLEYTFYYGEAGH